MAYVLLDFSYIYWVFHWHFKLPAPLNNSIPMALIGFGNRLKEGFSTAPKLAKQATPSVSRGELNRKNSAPKLPQMRQ